MEKRDSLTPSSPYEEHQLLSRQAQAWVVKIKTGRATQADLLTFKQWLAAGSEREQAFRHARQSWDDMGAVGHAWRLGHPEPVSNPRLARQVVRERRMFLGAAFSAAGAAAVGAMVFPPAGLWPSVFELGSDYRTATGEQRRIELAHGVVVELNTQSSLNVRADDGGDGPYELKLVSGEAVISNEDVRRELRIVAGKGVMLMASGEIELRQIEGRACLTCLRGKVQFEHAAERLSLQAGQQVFYDDGGGKAVQQASVDLTAPWRDGVLVFRDTPLVDAVAEINRYRPGRIVLLGRALGERKMSGKFQIKRLDLAIGRIKEAFGVTSRHLPGNVILLG
ncbi:FecR family protein [Polaromonas sp. YR568]|uniref:FecR family protein n=1 Tax=Polaromonas sp. YR568 TaxID=1855301 RepID=UPI00398BBCF6